jgi:cellulose synthase/poly-beta-1,6-N-acetylglucosamine synthase-like glycosyltransferase
MASTQGNTEIQLTQVSLVVTAVASALLVWSAGAVAWNALAEGRLLGLLEAMLFGVLAGFLAYGNLCYQVARIGQLKRAYTHRAFWSKSNPPFNHNSAPALTILIPSYNEEIAIIRQTLLSAALQGYPNKRVVLLLDNPPVPKNPQDMDALWAGRSLPFELQTLLKEPADYLSQAHIAFLARRSANTATVADECVRLSECFWWATEWFETQAKRSPAETHTDIWFIQQILTQPAEDCRERGVLWFARRREATLVSENLILDEIDAAYAQLAARFLAEFDVFERKQYCNLSHEPNKAMNLNSYLGLMGKRVRPVLRKNGVALEETSVLTGGRLIPETPYVITLDADSILMPQYASTLVQLMERPEHARTAVAQTPYSAIPNAPGKLERTAGATTDVQYFVHQGFTHYGATFWVGANALLRKSALDEICIEEHEGANTIRRYIQDRTVIEDTESTVDLLSKGWSLHNYPERLAYSATPPDFGSLVIQRARWANGGLIILPKLFSLLHDRGKQMGILPQALLQVHYLTSLAFAPLSVFLLLVVPFSSDLMTPWMPLAALPYFALYARDLAAAGYRPMRDLIRIYALNLLLIPVHLGGAITSIQQAVAGTKIPFRRTPKVSGRTRTSPLDLVLQLTMVLSSAGLAAYYGSQMRWISGTFALANAALLLYGIHQFIGFTEMKQDLGLRVSEPIERYVKHWFSHIIKGNVPVRISSSLAWKRTYTPQPLRAKFFTWPVLWSVIATLAILWPALASGGIIKGLNPIQVENRKSGTTDWILTRPARHHEIEGYASRTSVNRGDTLRLFVNTDSEFYTVRIFRMGWYGGSGARELARPIRRRGQVQPAPSVDPSTGLIECRWNDPIRLTIPQDHSDATDWASGVYVAKLTAEPTGYDSYITFVVRDDARASTYLVQSSVTTFQAYNNWGGKSLYAFNSIGEQAAKVSFDRPYASSPIPVATSGAGAGDLFTTNSIPVGYPASAAGWEYNMIRWLEKEGYDVTYATNIDVHAHQDLLESHIAFLSIGHDEYWSGEMRRNVEQARDRGIHLGFFSSNTCYWQIRMEPSRFTGELNRTIVAYKENAPWHDPLSLDQDPKNDHLVTTKWRNAPVNRPEAGLLGSMFLEVETPVNGDFVIEDAEGWITYNTGLTKGSSLRGVVGYEVDGMSASSPPGTHIVARSSVSQIAGTATVYHAASGAVVFSSGSMQWSWGLDDYNTPELRKSVLSREVQQMTRNILARLGGAEDR